MWASVKWKDFQSYEKGLLLKENVCDWVMMWIHWQPKTFYKSGIDCFVSQQDKCIISYGITFEVINVQ